MDGESIPARVGESALGPLAWQMHPPRLQNVPWAEEFPALLSTRTMTGEHVVERLSQANPRGQGAAIMPGIFNTVPGVFSEQ